MESGGTYAEASYMLYSVSAQESPLETQESKKVFYLGAGHAGTKTKNVTIKILDSQKEAGIYYPPKAKVLLKSMELFKGQVPRLQPRANPAIKPF